MRPAAELPRQVGGFLHEPELFRLAQVKNKITRMSEQAANHTGEVPSMHFSSLTVQKPISFRTRFQLCLTVVAGLLLPAIAPAQTFTPNWVQLSPATSPPARASYAMAYDAAHGQIVLFGGISFNGFLSDTWVWDGATWTQKSPATSPPDRVYSSMAYDAAHGQIVLFGGRNDGGNLSDTWVWDGTNWTQKSPATIPRERYGAAMAYDAAHGQIVLFGGENEGGNLSDTWVWDGSNWTQEAPATSPNGRYTATMTYDAAHGQIVLFGGADSSEFLNDTWLWNGSNWTLQSPGTSPGARFVSAMAYDASIGQTVLFGGNVSGYVNDTWLWDGTNWTEDFPATSPPARGLAAMAYDAASGQMVLFGGGASSEFLNDTWTWGLSSFGPQAVNTTSAAQTLNFSIPASTTVGSIAVFTQGATGLDFANAAGSTCTPQTYSSATTCTVNVSFTPKYPGLRMGAVVFFSGANNTGTILSTTYISGVGIGPQVAFNPAPAIAIGPTVGRLTLNLPFGVAVDGAGDLFIADTDNNRVVELPAGGGAAIPIDPTVGSTALNEPFGVAVDGAGDLFIADTYNNRVVELPAGGGAAIAIDPTVGSLTLNYSFGVAVDGAGDLFIADAVNNRVVELPAGGGPAIVLSPTVNGAQMTNPIGVTVDSAGDLFIADFGNNRVVKIQRPQPPTVSFPTATDDGSIDTDPTQTVQVSNSGNEPLIFSALSYPTDFPEASGDASACTGSISLSAGEECDLPIQFSPVSPASGPLSESVSLTTNATPAQQSVTVTGSAIDSPSTMTANAGTTPQSATVSTAFPNALAVTVLDAGGNPVAGVSVKFTAPATGASGTFSNGAGTITVLTNSSGVASAPITANATAGGFYTVTATANGLTTVNFHLMNLAGPPASMTATAGATPQTAYVTSAFGTALQVTVLDQYGNPVFGAVVTFTAPGSGASAALSSTAVITGLNGLASVTATANGVVGSYTVTASNSSLSTTFSLTNLPPPAYTVTTLTDDAGGAARNCNDTSQGATPNTGCSLRDAIAAAATVSTSTVTPTINFASSLNLTTSPPGDYNVTTGGTLNISKSMNIQGPGANLLSIDGGKADRVFNIASGTVSISEVTITNGNNGGNGGGIVNAGTLTVTNSTISGNSASGGQLYGGGIYNNGTLTVTNSTVSGNFVSGGPSGGIFNYSTLTLTNSIVDGNWEGTSSTVSQYDDLMDGSGNTVFTSGAGNNGGNLVGNYNTQTMNAPTPAIQLAPLGNYGGPTQTMLPLPGSPAICAISPSTATGTDQRGDPRTTTYGTTTCQDSGAVQTNYSIVFVQQPSTVVQNAAMLPAPTIQLDESGVAFADGTDTIAIPLSLMTGSGTLSGGSVSTSATTGVATYSALSISLPGTSDVLTANLTLNYATTPETAISIASNPFNVNSAVAQLVYNPAPATTLTAGGNAGSVTVNEENSGGTLVTTASDTVTLTVTGPGSYSNTYTVTAVNGVATFNLSSAALTTAGSYSYAASIAGNSSVTAANAPELVSAASAASATVVSGTPQSATIGTAFAAALKVKVMDQYGNPVQGASVSFSAPSSGASATFTGSPAATVADGTASVTATANGLAGTAAYTVTASVSGAGTTASFLLTNTQASTTLTVTPSPTAIAYGQPVTISAAITPASVLTSSPTGTITFYDGLTALTPASTVASANASCMVSVPVVGSHTYAAQYGGDTNFSQSSLTSATSSVVVGKASTTLSGPSSTVNLTYGAGGLITVSVAGQFSGAGIGAPSGSVSYTIGSGTAQSAAIVSGTATLTIPASQAAGSYTVTVSYSGDGNYNAATSIPVNLVISKATATVTLGGLSQTYTGAAISATATTSPANLAVTFYYSDSAPLPTAAGSYTVAGTVNDPNYQGSATGTLIIGKATAIVTLGGLSQTYTGAAFNATSTTSPANLSVNFTYNRSSTMPMDAGSYTVVGYIVDPNYQGSATGTMVVGKATATVTLGGLSQPYTGAPLAATATTNPAGLSIAFTYNGSAAAPTAAGTYTVVGTVNDPNYQGTATGTLTIAKATATVTLGSLSQTYTGSALSATATTTPANLTVTFTYNGLTATPTAAGTYTVIGTVNDPNYLGSAIGTLVINKATPTVAWATPAVITYGTALNATQLDASSPVAGTFAYSPAAGTVLAAGSQELSVTFTPTDATDYTAATASVTLTVNVQTQTTSLASSTLAYASGVLFGVPPLTLSATSTSGLSVTFTLLSGPATLSVNSLTVNGAGTVAITANQAGNANYAPAPQVVENITVNKALPIVSIASSANPVLLQNAITLSATIASGAGTPTGTVTFLDGSTPLGTGTLSGGVVTLTTSSLAAGTHSITAAYGGDANFLASTSSPLTQLVEDFNFNISSTSNNPSSSITVMPGGTAVFTFTVSPIDGSIFPSAVTLTLSGLPAGATYSFTPATITAGAGATAVTLTIDIPQTEADAKPLTLHPGAQLAVNRNGGSSGGQAGGVAGRLAPFSLALLLLPFAGRLRRTGKRLGRMMCALLLLGAGMATMAGMSGCGSTSGFFAQQQQSYTVTVTATSGALSHSATFTLTVE